LDLECLVVATTPSISSSTSIASGLCPTILSVHGFYHTVFVLSVDFFFTVPLLQDEPDNTLPNVTTLSLAQVVT